MGRIDFHEEKNVAVEDIMLDVFNARIRAGADQNDCMRRILRKRDQFLAICESVAKEGLTTMPILASPNGDGTFTVKDGNRRITALKLLNKPETCPEPDLVSRIAKIAGTYKNFPSKVDLIVTENDEVMIREVLSRHQGGMGGVGQLEWSAYLRTLYLLNHDHPAEYKRAGQYALWAEGQGIFVNDEFPISSLHRFFTTENLRLLGFDIDKDDNLKLNLPHPTVYQMTTKVCGEFGGGKSVNEVYTPEQAKKYIEEVRRFAGIQPSEFVGFPEEGDPVAPTNTSSSSASNDNNASDVTSSAPSRYPSSNLPPRPPVTPTPTTPAADRRKIFSNRSPGIAIPASGYPKAQTLVAELRGLDLTKFPLAAAMLLRALIELSDQHYRSANALKDQKKLAKNVKESVRHMLEKGRVSASEEDMVSRLCSATGAMIDIDALQKMVHRSTHNLDRQFVNTLWDNIGCFVKACWA